MLACMLCLLQSGDVDGNLPCCSWGSEVLGKVLHFSKSAVRGFITCKSLKETAVKVMSE